MASFENISSNLSFSLTIDDEKKTVSVAKISDNATADKLNTVAEAFDPLFAATPAKHYHTRKDEILSE